MRQPRAAANEPAGTYSIRSPEPASDMAEARRQFSEESPAVLSVLKDLGIQGE